MAERYGVIFDVDGVLVDSYDAHYRSWVRLGEEQGFTLSEQDFARNFGRTSREVIREEFADRGLTDEQVAAMDQRKEALYREQLAAAFPAMEGARELIDALQAAGFALAVGSSGPPKNVELTLAQLGRGEAFQGIVTGRDVTRGKPDPQVFLLGAQRLGLPPERCLVIEDAAPGLAAAHAAGMKAVGLVSTGHTRKELQAADVVVHSLRELSPSRIREIIDGA